MVRLNACLLLALALFDGGIISAATFSSFDNRGAFEGGLGTLITDDYSDPGYTHGDRLDTGPLDIMTNALMSSVVGETSYFSTGFVDWNMIVHQDINPFYCAGCNGSFLLDFTSSSLASGNGVFGVGFDYELLTYDSSYGLQDVYLLVTFGDATTAEVYLDPTGGTANAPVIDAFMGITSSDGIKSIHIGFSGGSSFWDGANIGIDNLTLGAPTSSQVPEPATWFLLGTGCLALVCRRKRP